jgi:phosphocarrier protein FPr
VTIQNNTWRIHVPKGDRMLELTIEQISMGQSAVDKPAALQLLANHLVADGLVAEGYLAGLQAREAQGSTFLGQGIAIPHGTPKPAIRCSPPACA